MAVDGTLKAGTDTDFGKGLGVSDTLETFGGPVGTGEELAYPIRGFRYVVDFEGLGIASFKSVEGFSSIDLENTTYREGCFGRLTMRKLPGLASYSDITLTKGLYNSGNLYNYFTQFLNGQMNTPTEIVTIKIYNTAGTAVAAQWEVMNVWPIHYDAGSLNADSSEILIETLNLANEGVRRVAPT
ncbi:MAG: phage tail protein [Candidatus Paraimprobicoccus trichonymphae]|uniref:Phage tail protein n=1 Tax=Candidatus Paraimprobicoccus trichonymphae TaxID=3033793 RepID=A0AA48I3P0_9FIRM|nr:MAG: phage tail protein [Candidatus Paraimprobicoccus trichonymphae]